jgi:magnesium transporter
MRSVDRLHYCPGGTAMFEPYAFEDGKLVPREEGEGVLVYIAPTEEEKREIAEKRGIDPYDLASALDPDELGRVELDGHRATIIIKQPRNYNSDDQLLFTVASVGLFLDRDSLIVVTTEPLELFDEKMVRKIDGPTDALLKVLYASIAHFLGHLKVINMISEALEKRINTSMGNKYLLDMFTLEKSLVYFVNGIGSNQMVLEKIRACEAKLAFTDDQREILDDILIENQQCAKQADIYSNILTGLMDARGSVVNNNLSTLMKKLTIISVVFMPMNVLASMGGMSEFSGWTKDVPPWVSYPIFLVFMCGIGLATYLVIHNWSGVTNDYELPRGRRKVPRKQ